MKFLIDAGLPPWMVEAFDERGFDVVHANQLGLGNAPDLSIAQHAQRDDRCLVTRDFDFADIRNYRPAGRPGVVVLVIPRHRGSPYMRFLLEELFTYIGAGRPTRGKLLVVEPGRIRVRD